MAIDINTWNGSAFSFHNADTLDSLHAASFLRSDADSTTTGSVTFSGAGKGINLKDATTASTWQLHAQGDRIRAFDGTTEYTYLTTTDTATNASKLNNIAPSYTYLASGSYIPAISYNGPLEIGQYLDFHMIGSAADFDARFSLDTNKYVVVADGRGSWFPASIGLNEDQNGRKAFIGGTHVFDANGSYGAAEIRGPGSSNPAIMAFHRPGAFATYFGLDTDNQFKFGGWSNGANKYPFLWNSSGQGGKVTISTADPSGGVDGDIWFKYTP
jgi:hypothetical protein